jgi:hypothetical protein
MNEARKQIFAGASFTRKSDRHLRARQSVQERENAAHRLRLGREPAFRALDRVRRRRALGWPFALTDSTQIRGSERDRAWAPPRGCRRFSIANCQVGFHHSDGYSSPAQRPLLR